MTVIMKTITIKPRHQKWVEEYTGKFSVWIQEKIDEEIEKYEEPPTLQQEINRNINFEQQKHE